MRTRRPQLRHAAEPQRQRTLQRPDVARLGESLSPRRHRAAAQDPPRHNLRPRTERRLHRQDGCQRQLPAAVPPAHRAGRHRSRPAGQPCDRPARTATAAARHEAARREQARQPDSHPAEERPAHRLPRPHARHDGIAPGGTQRQWIHTRAESRRHAARHHQFPSHTAQGTPLLRRTGAQQQEESAVRVQHTLRRRAARARRHLRTALLRRQGQARRPPGSKGRDGGQRHQLPPRARAAHHRI